MLNKCPQIMRKISLYEKISASNVVGLIELANQHLATPSSQVAIIIGLKSIRCVVDESQSDTCRLLPSCKGKHVTVPSQDQKRKSSPSSRSRS